jgi:hypothetical protein
MYNSAIMSVATKVDLCARDCGDLSRNSCSLVGLLELSFGANGHSATLGKLPVIESRE